MSRYILLLFCACFSCGLPEKHLGKLHEKRVSLYQELNADIKKSSSKASTELEVMSIQMRIGLNKTRHDMQEIVKICLNTPDKELRDICERKM